MSIWNHKFWRFTRSTPNILAPSWVRCMYQSAPKSSGCVTAYSSSLFLHKYWYSVEEAHATFLKRAWVSTNHAIFGSCASSNLVRGLSEIRNGEDLWQRSRMEIRLNAFCWSTKPQKQFIIIFIIIKYLKYNKLKKNFKNKFAKEWKHLLVDNQINSEVNEGVVGVVFLLLLCLLLLLFPWNVTLKLGREHGKKWDCHPHCFGSVS